MFTLFTSLMFENLRYGIEISVSKIYFKIVKRIFMNCWPWFFMIETHLVLRCMSWNIFMYCTGSRFWIFTLYNFTIIKKLFDNSDSEGQMATAGSRKTQNKKFERSRLLFKAIFENEMHLSFQSGAQIRNFRKQIWGKISQHCPFNSYACSSSFSG